MKSSAVSYKRHRFPREIISNAVWLYFRFPLSLRLVEEMLLERGIVVSYETIRRWGRKFGPAYAKQLRRRRPSRQDVWHLDEVVVSIAGRKHWLWRAVDQDGYVLDEIVQSRRDTRAAKRLLSRLLKKAGMPPKRIITDSSARMARPSVRLCRLSSTDPTRVSTIERRILICRCENENARCRVSDQQAACSGSSRSSRRFEISSSPHGTNDQHWPIASVRWRIGRRSREPSPDL
jgi:transposase-like protein